METTQSLSTMGDLLHLAHVALEGNWVWPQDLDEFPLAI